MAKALVVGCGDLGTEVIRLLGIGGHEAIGVSASDKVLPNGAQHIKADVTDASSLTRLKNIGPEIVVYCIAAKVQTDKSYQAHYVDGLENIIATQTQNTRLQHVFFVSSTRVYGQVTDVMLNESTPALPKDFGGERLLAAEELLRRSIFRGTSIRLSGIYGPGRLRLVNMAKENPARWQASNRWTNRIHRDDAARFIVHLCHKAIAKEFVHDCYIGTDNRPAQLGEVLAWLASKLGNTSPHGTLSGVIDGRRFSNQRMRETGFELMYSDYKAGFSEILKS